MLYYKESVRQDCCYFDKIFSGIAMLHYTFLKDAPFVNILLEKDRMEEDECICFTVEITSIPSPCHAQWNVKSKGEETFTPLDVYAAEYQGSTNSLPHPKLVVKGKDQLEKNCYQIEVTNFVGSTVKEISGKILH